MSSSSPGVAVGRWLVVAVIFISGCTSSNDEALLVSSRFGVCINLPRGASYSDHNQYIDYDKAILRIGESTVEVMIGGHPQFSRSSIERVTQAVNGFMLLGEERVGGKDKLLFGINRRNQPVAGFHGPDNELVMFSSEDLKSIKDVLLQERVLVDCRKPS